MLTYQAPICFYPTTVLVTKDMPLLNIVQQQCMHAVVSADILLKTLQIGLTPLIVENITQRPPLQAVNMHFFDSKCRSLLIELFNVDRFYDISVIVLSLIHDTDYTVDLLRQINNIQCKKLIIIDAKQKEYALALKEQGLIDSFLDQTQHNILVQRIEALQWQYFVSITPSLCQILDIRYQSIQWQQPDFAVWIMGLRKELDIVEYYLADLSGKFVCVDKHCKIYYLQYTGDIYNREIHPVKLKLDYMRNMPDCMAQ